MYLYKDGGFYTGYFKFGL
jgi:hypothetical protein